MVKKLLSWLLVFTVIFVLIGCASSNDGATVAEASNDTENAETTSKGTSTEKMDVEIWMHHHTPSVEWLQAKAETYNAEHDQVNIIVRDFPSGDLPEKVYSSMQAGTGPAAFDFLCLNYKSLIDKDIIAPVDWKTMGYESEEAFSSLWYDTAIEGVRESDGNFYALPYTGNTWSLFINKEHFTEAGLDPVADAPKTWEDVARLAEILTIKNENDEFVRKGFDLPFNKAPHWWSFVWGPILVQEGGSVLSEDGTKATINSPESVASLQILYDMVHKYKVTEPMAAVEESEDFLDGKTSMWVSGVWTKTTIGGREVEDKYMAVPLPQVDPENRKTVIGGYWWHVSNKVDKVVQDEAWKFLDYITSDPGDQFAATGLLMPKPSIMASQVWKDWPYNEVFTQDLEVGEWPVSSPVYPEIEKAIADAMERSLFGDMPPQESFDIAAEQIDQALAEH